MQSSRHHRFKRDSTITPIQLTERDRSVIRVIHQHRFLRSSHITALIGGSHQSILRRLQLLFHHGYLTRPRAQIDYFYQGGNRHIVYGIGSKGADVLREELGSAFPNVSWSEKNRRVGRLFFEHTLLVSDFMVALELACRKAGNIRLVPVSQLVTDGIHGSHTLKWSVNVNNHVKLGVIPDRVFALESDGESLAYFFLEADRGTMPVIRQNLSQSSFYRKLLAYQATWTAGVHRTQFGFHRFRVVTLTTSTARVQSLVEACAHLQRGHGLFLFTDQTTFRKANDLFSLLWKTGRGDTSTLF